MATKRPLPDPAAPTAAPDAEPADASVEAPFIDETTAPIPAPIPVPVTDATRGTDAVRRVREFTRALAARMRARRPRGNN